MMKAEEALALANKYTDTHGGGGGTSDYPDLAHKPQVNGVELVGNKTSSDLGLMPHYDIDERPTESSENLITSGGVWSADKEIEDKLQGSKTVEGNPLTVTDAEPMNAESVVVELEPKQDTHGYDNPWAGGAGKNKLPMTVAGIKAANTSGTWDGNVYTYHNMTYEILTDSGNNVTGIKVNGTATAYPAFNISDEFTFPTGNYILTPGGVRGRFYKNGTQVADLSDGKYTFTVSDTNDKYNFIIFTGATTVTSSIAQPMIRPATETDPTFAPYSNICPISGYSEVNVERDGDTYTIDLDGTKYGGTLDVTEGGYSDEWGYYTIDGDTVAVREGGDGFYMCSSPNDIISPSSESKVGNFICDSEIVLSANAVIWESQYGICDAGNGFLYIRLPFGGTTAEFNTWLQSNPISIAYKKTPSSASTTPTDIPLLENTNNISTDGTNIQLKYQPNNVIGECKAYTDEQCAKVLPQPPTTDGTYHLECSVSSGMPTITWVSNS